MPYQDDYRVIRVDDDDAAADAEYRIVQHTISGECYLVALTAEGGTVAGCGPLHSSELKTALSEGGNWDDDLLPWLRDEDDTGRFRLVLVEDIDAE